MTQEEIDFQYFRDNQLVSVDFNTGVINTKGSNILKYYYNVGSLNHDGYIRVWCNKTLRMKHRLLFWLYHNYLPEEIDHINRVRSDNAITNLQASNRNHNNQDKICKSFKRLTAKDVHEICELLVEGYTITYIAKAFSRSRVHIKNIKTKRHWSEISDNYF